jgi:hypothetical protein
MWYTIVVAGLVSAGVAGIAQLLNNRYIFDFLLRRQHEHEERKKLRELICRYKGGVLES